MGILNKLIFKPVSILYKNAPEFVKKSICVLIKRSHINTDSFYNRMVFNGKFKVKIPENRFFYMYHFGGLIENETFWKGVFESWEKDNGWMWMELCKFSNVIFDVGANTGIYSLVAKTINPNAQIFAFEPSRHTFKKLEINNQLNNFDIVCEKLAVSNQSGEQMFYDIPNPNQTTASLSPLKNKYQEKYKGSIWEYKVKTVRLEDFINSNYIDKIDLIKIDIELHEAEAIEGLGKYLIDFKPIIIFEILNKTVANKLSNLINLKEFQLFHLQKNKTAQKMKNFNLGEHSLATMEWNYIIFHNDLEELIKEKTSLFGTN